MRKRVTIKIYDFTKTIFEETICIEEKYIDIIKQNLKFIDNAKSGFGYRVEVSDNCNSCDDVFIDDVINSINDLFNTRKRKEIWKITPTNDGRTFMLNRKCASIFFDRVVYNPRVNIYDFYNGNEYIASFSGDCVKLKGLQLVKELGRFYISD